jgi:6-phosphogluconate dehydrogenase (decarboxylating)
MGKRDLSDLTSARAAPERPFAGWATTLERPGATWITVPAAIDSTRDEVAPRRALDDDATCDGGNAYGRETRVRRAKSREARWRPAHGRRRLFLCR